MTVDLLGLLVADLVEAGTPPPCFGRLEWTSDLAEEREAATYRCQPCPVLVECGLSADQHRDRFGVWGGRDRTHVPAPSRRPLPIGAHIDRRDCRSTA